MLSRLKILKLLDTMPEGLSATTVAEKLGVPYWFAEDSLQRMAKDRLISDTGDGIYSNYNDEYSKRSTNYKHRRLSRRGPNRFSKKPVDLQNQVTDIYPVNLKSAELDRSLSTIERQSRSITYYMAQIAGSVSMSVGAFHILKALLTII